MNFPLPDLYDFLRGPGFAISVTVFISGTAWRLLSLVRATKKISSFNMQWKGVPENTPGPAWRGITGKFRDSFFGTDPLTGVVSLLFHILIFITPVFLSAHNIIAGMTVGISLCTLPEHLTDIFTMLIISAGIFFLARRVFIPRVRILSTARDYFLLLAVMTPFISGLFAYHHIFNYHTVIYFHMITGEILLISAPFTGLVHMPFMLFSRFLVDSEYCFQPGSRRW